MDGEEILGREDRFILISYYIGADKLIFHSCRKILTLMFKFSGSKEGSKPQSASGDNPALALGACLSVSAFCPRFTSGSCSLVLFYWALKAAGLGLW